MSNHDDYPVSDDNPNFFPQAGEEAANCRPGRYAVASSGLTPEAWAETFPPEQWPPDRSVDDQLAQTEWGPSPLSLAEVLPGVLQRVKERSNAPPLERADRELVYLEGRKAHVGLTPDEEERLDVLHDIIIKLRQQARDEKKDA